MSTLSRRNTVIIAGILLAVVIIYGSQQLAKKPEEPNGDKQTDTGDQPVDVGSLSQEDLDALQNALEELEFDDLGGLSEEDIPTDDQPSDVGSLSQEDLDKLKEDLEGLEFEDLGGLSEG
jgi:hypothetical protein